MNQTFSVYLMADGTDYAQQTLASNLIDDTFITEGTRLICYNQLIYDDMHVELDEYAGLTLGVIDNNNVLTTIPKEWNQCMTRYRSSLWTTTVS